MCVISQLQKKAEKAGLSVVKKCEHHYQIIGGAFLVNYYPSSKKKTAYVAGTRTAFNNVTPEQAIAMTGKVPAKVASPKKRKRHKLMKSKMLKKQKGLCCWCGELMVVTDDATDPLQATIEHIIPLGRGGLDNGNNIKIAHQKCNHDRGNEMPELRK